MNFNKLKFSTDPFEVPKIMVFNENYYSLLRCLFFYNEQGEIIQVYATGLAKDGGNEQARRVSDYEIEKLFIENLDIVEKIFCNTFPITVLPDSFDEKKYIAKTNYYFCINFWQQILPIISDIYKSALKEKHLVITDQTLRKRWLVV